MSSSPDPIEVRLEEIEREARAVGSIANMGDQEAAIFGERAAWRQQVRTLLARVAELEQELAAAQERIEKLEAGLPEDATAEKQAASNIAYWVAVREQQNREHNKAAESRTGSHDG